jgi:hypothetical protein
MCTQAMPLGDFLQAVRISSFIEMPMRHETKQGAVDQDQVTWEAEDNHRAGCVYGGGG